MKKAKKEKQDELAAIEKHNFFIQDFKKQLAKEKLASDELNKRIEKLTDDINFHKNSIDSIERKQIRQYINKCGKLLFTKPGYDWIKIMPLSHEAKEFSIILIHKKNLKDATIQIIDSNNYSEVRQLKSLLFPQTSGSKVSTIKESKSLKQQFQTVNTILRVEYATNALLQNKIVLRILTKYLFCADNPYLKIG